MLHALGGLLPRWLGEDWKSVAERGDAGQPAAAISAQQIVRLAEIADMFDGEPKATLWFTAEGGTQLRFVAAQGDRRFSRLQRYLAKTMVIAGW